MRGLRRLPIRTELRMPTAQIPAVRACGLSCVLERETAQTARQGPQVRAEWQRMCVRPDSQEVGLEAATPSKSA